MQEMWKGAEMAENTVTAEQLASLLRKKSGQQTLSVLGHYQPFQEAINTSIGKELLNDAIIMHESLLQKVASLEATPEETMEYKAYRRIIMRWSEKLARYEQALSELK